MSVKLLTEHNLEFLSVKGSPESMLVKMPYCWKSHVATQIIIKRGPKKKCSVHWNALMRTNTRNNKTSKFRQVRSLSPMVVFYYID